MKPKSFIVVCLVLLGVALMPETATLADRDEPITKQLAELMRQRLKTAERVSSDYRSAFEAETISVDQFLGAMRKLTAAQRAVATSPRAELEVLKVYVQRLKQLYAKIYPPRESEMGERHDYPDLLLEIETAEIDVLEFHVASRLSRAEDAFVNHIFAAMTFACGRSGAIRRACFVSTRPWDCWGSVIRDRRHRRIIQPDH